MVIGPVTFLAPLALFGLLALPLIWWILRITPPKPKDQIFPPLKLLMSLKKDEEAPNSTPIYLLLYRLFLGALMAIALANPVLFKPDNIDTRPLVLVIDNGWAAAGNWDALHTEAVNMTKKAATENQMVAIVTTAYTHSANEAKFLPARDALKYVQSLKPLPYSPERDKYAEHLSKLDISNAEILWLSDGVDYGHVKDLTAVLKTSASHSIYLPESALSPLLAGEIQESANGFRSEWHRLNTNSVRTNSVAAFGPNGRVIARAPLKFPMGNTKAEAVFDLPSQLRNQISRLRVEGFASAGSTILLDDNWGRPLIGLLKGSDENSQPLLSEWHYIENALSPNADIYKGDLDQLLAVSPSMIFMTDRARTESEALNTYVKNGGLLVRFAGPKLAKRADTLLPVALRVGGRDIGGALAWEEPQQLAAFESNSPFFGLNITEEITVQKQIMARPGTNTDANTWARLEGGSPVITSAPSGLGRIVLFHVTAGPEWSSLPISGLYVQLLKRILPLARGTGAKPDTQISIADWTPKQILNGYGQLGTPPYSARPIASADFANTKVDFNHPPGIYSQSLRRAALNTIGSPDDYKRLTANGLPIKQYGGRKPKSLMGFLLGVVALLLIFDVALSLLASGRFRVSLKYTTPALALMFGLALLPFNGFAQETNKAKKNTDALDLHLAYIVTGNRQVDTMSRAGLEGLKFELDRRTTIEPVGVRAINLDTDPVDFYPFLYWPVMRDAKPLSERTSQKINAYMASGGTLVFDTQDYDRQKLLGNQTHPGLAAISKSLDIPRLGPPPKTHVITKSFYLLKSFPGRWAGSSIWMEMDQRGTARDGVSSVIVGSNDWASAWAKDNMGRTLAVIEDDIPRQREFAYRFGVNLAMYALAGNYKADQVHAATLIERLGTDENQPLQDIEKLEEGDGKE